MNIKKNCLSIIVVLFAFIKLTNINAQTAEILFVDEQNAITINYGVEQSLKVQITDPDQNTDANSINTVTVTLSSTTEPEGELLTLTETGISTGIFIGSMDFDENVHNNGDGLLQVSKGEKVTASHLDPSNDFGNPETVNTTAYYGYTIISGSIATNTTLLKSNSPYLVTGDVTVEEGVTLTVEPGVEIRIMPLSDDQASGDISRIEFIIDGEIIANGTENNIIKWMVNGDDPKESDWYGIRLSGDKNHSSFCYNTFEHANTTIYVGYCNDSNNELTIEHNTFQYSETAIHFQYSIIPTTIEFNTFENISKSSIFGKSCESQLSVNNNTFKNSDWNGITLNYDRYVRKAGSFNNNIFSDIGNIALYISSGGVMTMEGNVISNCNYGIYVDTPEQLLIRNNTIKNNSKTGLTVINSDANIEKNTITENSSGIDLQASSSYASAVTLTYNTIIQNQSCGIRVGKINDTQYDYVTVVANYNNLYGYQRYSFANYTANPQNAKYNYWGETTTNQINAGGNPQNLSAIYDQYENSSLGFVNYAFYLDAYSCYHIETTESVSICEGELYSFAGQQLTESGEYQHIFMLKNGCDSIANLILSVTSINTNILRDGNTLTAEADNALYQWLDASTTENTAIAGETNRNFTPDAEGKFALSISQHGCTAISETFDFGIITTLITNTSIEDKIKIYPNPSSGLITIEPIETLNNLEVEIFNMFGEKIFMQREKNNILVVDIREYPNGTYIIKLNNDGESMNYKIIKH